MQKIGDTLDQDTISKLIQSANSHNFDWGGAGYAQWSPWGDNIVKDYLTNFNRLPTNQEFQMAEPQFHGAGGDAYVASLAQQQDQLNKAPQQEADALQKQIPIIQNLINSQTQATAQDLTNPNSPTYQSFSGMMNNMGITPSSGAFQAGMGGVLGQNASQAINSALGSVGLPIASGYAQGSMAPFNSAMGRPDQLFQHGLSVQDFLMQSDLAKSLSNSGNPSGAQNILSMATGSAQGGGSLLQGASAAKNATSYVCKELIKRDLLCESDMDDFHFHIMPAMFKKGRAFWKYAMDGYKLVQAVNKRGLNWAAFKPLLFDRVMDEPDACKAVDLYADACHQLCISSDRSLWDKRVYRTSLWDSLLFLPMLFLYKPFREALLKCLNRKFAIVYDKPRCGVHR